MDKLIEKRKTDMSQLQIVTITTGNWHDCTETKVIGVFETLIHADQAVNHHIKTYYPGYRVVGIDQDADVINMRYIKEDDEPAFSPDFVDIDVTKVTINRPL